MAKRYTRAQWEELQASFPPEDRTPYESSPDLPASKPTGFEDVVDFSFAQAAVRQPTTTTKPSTFNQIRDFGFEQAAEAAGQPFVPPTLVTPSQPQGPGQQNVVTPGAGTKPPGGQGTLPVGGQGTIYTASDGKTFTDINAFNVYQQNLDKEAREDALALKGRKSAFDLLREEFSRYGLGFLIEDSEKLAREGLSPEEFEIGLRNTKAYKDRFIANDARIAAGYSALSPAEYLALEDAYQRTMRQYGLPKSFYEKTSIGNQPELDKLIGFNVSPAELEDRIQLAVERVNNASPEVLRSLEEFYPGISKANIVAYVLDPDKALPLIQRQIRAAELGGEAMRAGLRTGVQRAEELERLGITQGQAREGFQTIAGGLTRGSQLAAIYKEEPYTQETAEQEVFQLGGATQARRQRQKITRQEQAAFGGTTGITGGALSRDRAGQY